MKIRKAVFSDLEHMTKLYRIYRAPDWNPPAGVTEQTMENLPSCVLVNDNDDLIGFSYCLHFAPDIAEIANIYVDNDYRNRGLGGQLLKFLESEAKAKGLHALVAVNSEGYPTLQQKKKATGLYLKNGFKVLHETPQTRVFLKEL